MQWEHKGIEYTVKRVGGPRPWTWLAYTSPQLSGAARSQISAMMGAKDAISAWCKANPTLCAPHVAQPIDLGSTDSRGRPN